MTSSAASATPSIVSSTAALVKTPLWQISPEFLSFEERIKLSFERAKSIAQHYKLTIEDIFHPSEKYWHLHSDPLIVLDGAVGKLLTFQYNVCLGTFAKYLDQRLDLQPIVDMLASVSIVSEGGVENLGLFRVKDTVRNIRATKGFTVNTVSEAFVDNANAYSIDAPPEISEWPLSGLTKEPSIHVKAPRVKESAFSMECELLQTVDIVEPNSLKATTTLVLGTVKLIHMRRDTLDPVRGLPDPGKLKPVMRLGGMTYAKLGDGFQVPLPAWENMKDEIRETLGKEVVTGRNN